jgi:signal transduction histidine kinase/DNA-binding response OmpR family regulator/CHASE3 domain sensor protein
MKLSIRTLNIIFSISLLLLISSFVYSYLNIQGLRSANRWVNHTNEVILRLESIYSGVKNAESGVRGYALTKDVSHIESQPQVRKNILIHLHVLDSLIVDNPEQQLFLDTLQVVLNERISLFNGLINLTNNNADEVEVLNLMRKAKASTGHINNIIEAMKQNESILLIARNETAEALDNKTPITIVLSGILGFIVLSLAYYFILQDLRERRKITIELETKNSLLEYAQQITQMGTFEYFVHSNQLSWSAEMYNIFEVDKSTIPQIDFIDTLVMDESKNIHKSRKENFLIGERYSDELKIRTESGDEKIILSNGYATNEDGVLVVHGAIIDITPLKKAELIALEQEQLMRLAKEKAESASQFKSRFLSNMSHEIRTPINAILGFTKILTKQVLTNHQKDLLKNISISGELLLKLIGNILDISKIEEGKVLIDSKSFHLKESIRSVLSPFKHSASENGLQFDLLIDEYLPDYVLGDSPRISQVLVNLIGNAFKFTSHGNVTVTVKLKEKKEDMYFIEFSVSDTGIGIQENNQKDIFESFTQANESISVKYGGSGLGLSIVQEVIHLMGGQIQVQSPIYFDQAGKGYGSKFFFTIPFKLGEKIIDKHSHEDAIKPFPRVLNILVADDNEMNRKLASYTLQSLGCTYEIVEDGLQAVHKASENKYDIILMDMQMPICDGLQATRQIRENKINIPIIGLTANIFQEDIDNCIDAGMDDHLGKPYTDEDLYYVIDKWCFNNQKIGERSAAVYSNYSFIEKLSKNDSGIFREMLEMFQTQNFKLLKEINTALVNSDLEALSFQLHQYKSCVRMLSIEKQSLLITQLERKIEEPVPPIESISADIEQLIFTGELISKEIEQKLLTL